MVGRTARSLVDVPADGHVEVSRDAEPQPRTSVLLPAYNEERGLATVLEKLQRLLDRSYEIVVVDDGSHDRTALVAERHGVRVIRHHVNRGKGAAMQSGLLHVRGDRVITVDADDTYPAEAIPEIAAALDTYELVLTTRRSGRFNISPVNRVGNAMFRRAISTVAGYPASDPLSGLYGLRRHLLDRLNLVSNGFGIEAEIVIKAGRLRARTLELPIVYRPRVGESKLHPVRDGLVIGRTIVSMARAKPPRDVAPAPVEAGEHEFLTAGR
jgi:glycosyltransferase involved in cell wall biosynthesis